MNTTTSEETYTSASLTVEVPFDLIRLSIDEVVLLKCKKGREVRGRLHAYDEHMNAILGDVTEKHTYTEVDPDTKEEKTIVHTRKFDILFVRGDQINIVVPPIRA